MAKRLRDCTQDLRRFGQHYRFLMAREPAWIELLKRIRDGRHDYDSADQERCALIAWKGDRWDVVKADAFSRKRELVDLGLLLFGPPAWRRSMVLFVVGRLGALETTVAAMAAPGPDFVFNFRADEVPGRVVELAYARPGRKPRQGSLL